ncbi:uncharacterized protein LOC142761797 [Rhipicephalus microplus]|uniref:uncharacterized protein LOC142761797 n=1 Tax=Rhipicephalus microplus TaxID=6941 RepID=UPI003F6D0C2A
MHQVPEWTPARKDEAPKSSDATRSSRRLQGLPPELGTLPECTRQKKKDSTPTMSLPAAPTPVILQQPRVPPTFHGSPAEDAEDWLDQITLVASLNKWGDEMKVSHVFFALDGPAKTWFENHEASLTTWEVFKTDFLRTFTNMLRKERAEILLQSRIQKPNETVPIYDEEMTLLIRRVDPNMAEEKQVGLLMRGVKEFLFACIVRNPPKTIAEFTQEASIIEKTLDSRNRQYNLTAHIASMDPQATLASTSNLREIIREVVREELRFLIPSPSQPPEASLTDVIREEVRIARGVSRTATPCQENQGISYAAAVRSPRGTANMRREHYEPPQRSPSPVHSPVFFLKRREKQTSGEPPTDNAHYAFIAVSQATSSDTALTNAWDFVVLPSTHHDCDPDSDHVKFKTTCVVLSIRPSVHHDHHHRHTAATHS